MNALWMTASLPPFVRPNNYDHATAWWVWGTLFDMGLITAKELTELRTLNSSIRDAIQKRVESNAIFRIPPNRTITTLAPHRVAVYTTNSIPPTTRHLIVSHFNHTHCNMILSSLPHNLHLVELTLEVSSNLHFTSYIYVDSIKNFFFSTTSYNLDDLPPTITHLTTGDNFNQHIKILPPSLKRLTLNQRYNKHIKPKVLPQSLTHLTTGWEFNQNVDNLPPKLIYFSTGRRFNRPVDNLPSTLTHLLIEGGIDRPPFSHNLEDQFDQPINKLPSTLTHLYIGDKFNHPLYDLPLTITHLRLGYSFEQPSLYLPPGLISLTLGFCFCHRIGIPLTLRQITIRNFDYNATNAMLPPITHLNVYSDFNPRTLPPTITHLTSAVGFSFNCEVTQLPLGLTHLTTGFNFDRSLGNLPKTLTHLTFGYSFNQPLTVLPASLTHLTLGNDFNQSLGKLPRNLTHLTIGDTFNQTLDELPNNLTHLIIGNNFNSSLQSNLPSKLTNLTLGDKFNQSVSYLPDALKRLSLGDSFNQFVNNLPPELTHLTVGQEFDQIVDYLPRTLIYLSTGRKFNRPIYRLPRTIAYVITGAQFNQPHHALPPTAIHLIGVHPPYSNVCSCTLKHYLPGQPQWEETYVDHLPYKPQGINSRHWVYSNTAFKYSPLNKFMAALAKYFSFSMFCD